MEKMNEETKEKLYGVLKEYQIEIFEIPEIVEDYVIRHGGQDAIMHLPCGTIRKDQNDSVMKMLERMILEDDEGLPHKKVDPAIWDTPEQIRRDFNGYLQKLIARFRNKVRGFPQY